MALRAAEFDEGRLRACRVRRMVDGVGSADEVGTALEHLSPLGSMIRGTQASR